MRLLLLTVFVLAGAFATKNVSAQNTLINVLTRNSGTVSKGETVFVEVTICNTDALDSIPAYKLKPQISVPASIAGIPPKGHELPDGWTITSNDGATIRLSNGTDKIPAHGCRTILIAVKGNTIGGPSTISGNLSFSNGVAPGSAPGAATVNDNPADNSSTSTCTVTR
jgi:hypothetical protein